MTTLEDTGSEGEGAIGFEYNAHVAVEQLKSESDFAGGTASLSQNGPPAPSESSSSDGEDDSNQMHMGSGYVLLSQEDSHENEPCTCHDECVPGIEEVLQTDKRVPDAAEGDFQAESELKQSDVITLYAEPGAFIAPVAKMEGDEVSAIVKAMSGFTLPATVTPDWAKVVPEEVWKAELLAGLRKHSKHQ